VPPAASAGFLAAAARACGDRETAGVLETWLDGHFRKAEGGRVWLETQREWRIGVTANRALALAQAHGSDLRALVLRPLPRDYFHGLLLESVEPSDTPVFQAYRTREGALVVEFDGQGKAVALKVKNGGHDTTAEWRDQAEGKWSPLSGTLSFASCGRLTVSFLPGRVSSGQP